MYSNHPPHSLQLMIDVVNLHVLLIICKATAHPTDRTQNELSSWNWLSGSALGYQSRGLFRVASLLNLSQMKINENVVEE